MNPCLCTPSRDCTTVPGVEPLARAHAHPNLRRCCEGGSRTFLGSDLVFREDTAGSLGGSGGKGTKWWLRLCTSPTAPYGPSYFTYCALWPGLLSSLLLVLAPRLPTYSSSHSSRALLSSPLRTFYLSLPPPPEAYLRHPAHGCHPATPPRPTASSPLLPRTLSAPRSTL